ncbi:hypothetical protein EHS25_000892 [Saitozyma podzolica]|uniref:Major facilitator superfamily (MFS) profile domain-containing protein n=1 Tax=Saitozyma podzolica TaxID=1890683 RepID=A0A427YXJ3_9TREE|nr:hypothetical protein EHS25_000892 [Saitozyma podzolica]
MPALVFLYLISFVDRGTLSNASILGIKTDLHIDTTQYNLLATVFLFTYSFLDIPSNWVLQKIRANIWIAVLCFVWGVITILSGLAQNYSGAIAARVFLGVAEAGFFVSRDYCSREPPLTDSSPPPSSSPRYGTPANRCNGALPFSTAWAPCQAPSPDSSRTGWLTWTVELVSRRGGLVTVTFAPFIVWILPNSPSDSKWLSDDEKELLFNICASGGGSPHVPFRKGYLYAAFKDIKVWMVGMMGVGTVLPMYGFSYTLPTILTQLGYTAEQAQLMTVPIYAVSAVTTLVTAWISDRIGRRAPGIMICFAIAFVGLLTEFLLPKTTAFVHARYGALFLIPTVVDQGKRAMSSALELTMANVSAAIGTNAPNYPTGFGISLATVGLGFVLAGLLWWMLARENARRENLDKVVVNRLSPVEIEEMGDSAPTFRYIL